MGIGRKKIQYSGETFSILRVATGTGVGDIGGSYPVIELYTKSMPRLIVGSEHSGNYALGKFLILPPHEWIQVEDQKILVGSVDKNIIEKLKKILIEEPALSKKLFQKKFSHLTISSRIDVGLWPVFQKKYVLNYVCLPEEAYNDQAAMESFFKAILIFKTKLIS